MGRAQRVVLALAVCAVQAFGQQQYNCHTREVWTPEKTAYCQECADCVGTCVYSPKQCFVAPCPQYDCSARAPIAPPVAPASPCASKKCGETCIVEGDMAGLCDTVGKCSFEYAEVKRSCAMQHAQVPLAVGDVCLSGGVETGPGVNRAHDCPGGSECRMQPGVMAIGGEVAWTCQAIAPASPCASKKCGETCLVEGDMAGLCDTAGKCSFEYDEVTRSCATAPAPPPTMAAATAHCSSWYDGCNTCGVVNGQVAACTEMACFRQGTPKCLKCSWPFRPRDDGSCAIGRPTPPTPKIPEGPPAWCTSWYDGCNTCRVENGKVTACTKMACSRQGTPQCRGYLEDRRLDGAVIFA